MLILFKNCFISDCEHMPWMEKTWNILKGVIHMTNGIVFVKMALEKLVEEEVFQAFLHFCASSVTFYMGNTLLIHNYLPLSWRALICFPVDLVIKTWCIFNVQNSFNSNKANVLTFPLFLCRIKLCYVNQRNCRVQIFKKRTSLQSVICEKMSRSFVLIYILQLLRK